MSCRTKKQIFWDNVELYREHRNNLKKWEDAQALAREAMKGASEDVEELGAGLLKARFVPGLSKD